MKKNGTREKPFLLTVAVISSSRGGPSHSAVGVEVLGAANRFTAEENQHLASYTSLESSHDFRCSFLD